MPKTDHRVVLTPTKISGLQPAAPGQRYQVMDAQVPGFGVRVTDHGSRSFILRTRYPGANSASRRELGDCLHMSLADARAKARRWKELIEKGLDPQEEEERERLAALRRRQTTFKAVAEDFIAEKLPSERNRRDVENEIRRELMPTWQNLPITDISDLSITELIKKKAAAAPVAARNLLALVKRFFRWVIAQRKYGLTSSPCADVRASDIVTRSKRTRGRILCDDELFALWRAASRTPYPLGPAYQLLCLTALRLNEAVDASKEEINRREGVWVIPAERMKGRDVGQKQARPHAVPLTPDILAIFDSLPKQSKGKFLFSTTAGERPTWMGSKVKRRLDQRMLRTLKALARYRGEDPVDVELANFCNHDIRRTVRSHLSRLKITEEAREAVLAHARPGIAAVYDHHSYLPEKREALELWNTRLRVIVQAPSNNVVKLRAMA